MKYAILAAAILAGCGVANSDLGYSPQPSTNKDCSRVFIDGVECIACQWSNLYPTQAISCNWPALTAPTK